MKKSFVIFTTLFVAIILIIFYILFNMDIKFTDTKIVDITDSSPKAPGLSKGYPSTTIINNSKYNYNTIFIKFVLYEKNGREIGNIKSEVNGLLSGESKNIKSIEPIYQIENIGKIDVFILEKRLY